MLEEVGIDFTAHVIGFYVGGDAAATAQMQCIAEETGGMFIPAADAGELAAAVTTVVEEPAPIIADVTFQAVLGDISGPMITDPILWTFTNDAGNTLTDTPGNPVTASFVDDSHQVTAYHLVAEFEVQTAFDVTTADSIKFTVVFPEPAVTASVTAPATAPMGSTIDISWVGPGAAGDYISIAPLDVNAGIPLPIHLTATTAALRAPSTAGDYLITYFIGQDRTAMHSVPISITATHATITVSATAQAGSTISVDWTGPNLPNDNLDIGQVGADGSHLWENFAYTSAGSPVDILVPTEVGDYEITYFIGQDRTKLTTVPISVTEVTASITAPPTAIAGSTIDVSWTGPDYDNDYIGIGAVGATGSAQGAAFADTNAGNPVTITLPDAPGDNVISYFLQQDRTTIATRPLTIE